MENQNNPTNQNEAENSNSVSKVAENFRIKNATFVLSVADFKNIPKTDKPEIAIAGKSNVGKSSFINLITNQKKLARTSSDPGRTRLLNYFEINQGEFYFVDLPGYGYAKVAKTEKAKWGDLIEGYLTGNKNLKNVFVLLDVRLEPSEDDKVLLNFLQHYLINFTIVATKCDKLSRSQNLAMKTKIANALSIGTGNIILTSALKKTGKEEILSRIAQILE
ncbi:MAG TPA: ribosome biogenesis GTP-binding protein YihA/YsxC [Clostridia bacterium]|nr:ribosome biogenesis GTP-binding protein YihA/YsxC [Clostridia bacterium]